MVDIVKVDSIFDLTMGVALIGICSHFSPILWTGQFMDTEEVKFGVVGDDKRLPRSTCVVRAMQTNRISK